MTAHPRRNGGASFQNGGIILQVQVQVQVQLQQYAPDAVLTQPRCTSRQGPRKKTSACAKVVLNKYSRRLPYVLRVFVSGDCTSQHESPSGLDLYSVERHVRTFLPGGKPAYHAVRVADANILARAKKRASAKIESDGGLSRSAVTWDVCTPARRAQRGHILHQNLKPLLGTGKYTGDSINRR